MPVPKQTQVLCKSDLTECVAKEWHLDYSSYVIGMSVMFIASIVSMYITHKRNQ